MTSRHLTDGTDLAMFGLMNPATGQPVGAVGSAAFASGTLANTTPLVVPLSGAALPSTITISGAGGTTRKIELSTDGGSANGWFTPTPDASTTNMVNLVFTSAATHARLTGGAGDAWSVR